MITSTTPDTWQALQDEVALILKECGFTVELEKTIETVRGTVEVDVYAEEYVKGRKYSILCECKHWKSAIPQTVIHSFRTVVSDIGAHVGYIISLNGFQSGSIKASELTNLKLLTWKEFQNEFEESWYDEYFAPTVAKNLNTLIRYNEPFYVPKWFVSLPEEEKNRFRALLDKYEEFGVLIEAFTPIFRMIYKRSLPTLPVAERIPGDSSIFKNVPEEILKEEGYREFLNAASCFGEQVIKQFREIRDRNKG